MTVFDEIELLQQFRAGNPDAFEQVFDAYFKPLMFKAWLLLNDEDEAQEQVQQFFIDIFSKKLYEQVDINLGGWLHRSIKNRCLNVIRDQQAANKRYEQYALHEQIRQSTAGDEEDLPDNLKHALASLPEQRLEAFNLVYLDDFRYKEAAGRMGITVNSLKTHLRLALKALRQRLDTKKDSPGKC